MNRRRFVEIFSFLPLIGGINFDDYGRPGMPNLEGISEKLLLEHEKKRAYTGRRRDKNKRHNNRALLCCVIS